MRKSIWIFLAALFFLSSCWDAVTYPKETITESIRDLVFKEIGLEAETTIVGKTVYVDVGIDGFFSQEKAKEDRAYDLLQKVFTSATRVILSGDSDIKIIVVNAFSSGGQLFRIMQNIDDFKAYYYMAISQSDYDSRGVFEVYFDAGRAQMVLKDKHDILTDEFVGRLILSSLEAEFRTTPFLEETLSFVQPFFLEVKDETAFFQTPVPSLDSQTRHTLEIYLLKHAKKYSKKYPAQIKKIKLINPKSKVLLSMSI